MLGRGIKIKGSCMPDLYLIESIEKKKYGKSFTLMKVWYESVIYSVERENCFFKNEVIKTLKKESEKPKGSKKMKLENIPDSLAKKLDLEVVIPLNKFWYKSVNEYTPSGESMKIADLRGGSLYDSRKPMIIEETVTLEIFDAVMGFSVRIKNFKK